MAWFVVGLVIAYYIMVYDYSLDAFRGKDDFETVSAEPNPVDGVFLSTVRECRSLDYSQATVETRKTINKMCNKVRSSFLKILYCTSQLIFMYLPTQCIVGFADLQIMTGIGILISGILPTICGLQAYHWQVIVHLAWFSSITHLSALSFLRHYLINRRRQYYVRGILMVILAGLLGRAVGLAGHFDWEDPNKRAKVAPSHYARCVFMEEMDPETLAFESMVFDLMLIAYGYTIRLLKTWKQASNWPVMASKYLRDSSSSRLKSTPQKQNTKTVSVDKHSSASGHCCFSRHVSSNQHLYFIPCRSNS